MSQTLKGKTILVARERERADEMTKLLEAEGGRALVQPPIQTLPVEDPSELDDALTAALDREFDWAIFSSVNGVKYALDRLEETKKIDARELSTRVAIAAVGATTRDYLRERGLTVDIVPQQFDADGLVDALFERIGKTIASQKFLSLRASRGRKTLSERLTSLGATVRETIAYRSVDVEAAEPGIVEAAREGRIDAGIVASSASASAVLRLLGESAKGIPWFAISELTATALRKEGARVGGVAREATARALFESVLETFSK